jgi:hypothetical protein
VQIAIQKLRYIFSIKRQTLVVYTSKKIWHSSCLFSTGHNICVQSINSCKQPINMDTCLFFYMHNNTFLHAGAYALVYISGIFAFNKLPTLFSLPGYASAFDMSRYRQAYLDIHIWRSLESDANYIEYVAEFRSLSADLSSSPFRWTRSSFIF